MYQNKKVIAIIPARGGSKGIPRKNIKLLNGKPLIAYSIKQAKDSEFIDRIIVSTEDEEIAGVAADLSQTGNKSGGRLARSIRNNCATDVLQTGRNPESYPCSWRCPAL